MKSIFPKQGRRRVMMVSEPIIVGGNSYEKVKTFKYLGSLLTNQNSIHEEIKFKIRAENSCYYSVQTVFFSL